MFGQMDGAGRRRRQREVKVEVGEEIQVFILKAKFTYQHCILLSVK